METPPATANEKISRLKRLFRLAVMRGRLDANPFRHLGRIKVPARKVRVYSDAECYRLLDAARDATGPVDWALLITVALATAERRGEVLNTTWSDIDFGKLTISVSPKPDTPQTWEWRIKDSERRTLPPTQEVADLPASRRRKRPTLDPYVFIPTDRYGVIQQRRRGKHGTMEHSRLPLNNFGRSFRDLLKKAEIETGGIP